MVHPFHSSWRRVFGSARRRSRGRSYTRSIRSELLEGRLVFDSTIPYIVGANLANEGSVYTLELSATGPNAGTISQWQIDWGDDSDPDGDNIVGELVEGNPPSVTHIYADGPQQFTITASATDDDGTHSVATPPVAQNRWLADSNPNDSVGVNHGWLERGVLYVPGRFGDAFSFNGAANSFITLKDLPQMMPASQQLSIDAWIKPDFSVANQWDTILTKRDGCGSAGIAYLLGVNKGDPGFLFGSLNLAMNTTGGFKVVTSAAAVPNDGLFHHVAGTYDGSTMRVYIDGELMGEATLTGNIIPAGSAPVISHHGGDCPQKAVAAMDEIGFYDRALTADEIQDLASGSRPVVVKVQNVAPALLVTGPASASAGSAFTLNLATNDPGADTISQWTIDWGDGQIQTIPGNPSSAQHIYSNGPNDYEIVATAEDDDGKFAAVGDGSLVLTTGIPNVISQWAGDGDALDQVGGNHGSLQGGVSFTTGIFGQAFEFNGASESYISLPNTSAFLLPSQQLTIDAWIKPDLAGTNVWDTILTKRDGCSSPGIMYNFGINKGDTADPAGHGTLAFVVNTTAGYGRVSSSATEVPDDGSFHHVAATYDGTIMRLYLDGGLVGETVWSGDLIVAESAPVISHHGGVCPQRADAAMDQIGLYDRALTWSEIHQLAHPARTIRVHVGAEDNSPLIPVDDSAVTTEDHAAVIDVLANDTGSAPLTIVSVGDGLKGTTHIDDRGTPDSTDDVVVYTPALGATGEDVFSYTVSDSDGDIAIAFVAIDILNLVDVSGRVYKDANNDGLFDAAAGDAGIGGAYVQLWNQTTQELISSQSTAADGTYTFDANLGEGSYRIFASQTPGLLDGFETAGNLGGSVYNANDSDEISDLVVGAPGSNDDAVDYLFAEIEPGEVFGLVWEDFNNDGVVNFDESPIPNAMISLDGVDDRGAAVHRTVLTDSDGVYAFIDLRPSDADGYTISELQPSGYADGKDVLGTVDGVLVGNAFDNDVLAGVVLTVPNSTAANYNFGERPIAESTIGDRQTAGIAFWANNHGQALIEAANGGPSATNLGNWLAATFPNMYGAHSGAMNLTGKSNAEIASMYEQLFRRNKKSAAGGGPPKFDAQVMATALAVYMTNENLAGTIAESFGLDVSQYGVGVNTINIETNGAAFGLANGSILTVFDLLSVVNQRAYNGLLFDLDLDGDATDSIETQHRTMANSVFSTINEAGQL